MKHLMTLTVLLIIAGTLFSCQKPEPEVPPIDPVTVESLVTPRDSMTLWISNATSGLTFEWEASEWHGEGKPRYRLVFDVPGGDFSEPRIVFEVDTISVTLTQEQIREVYDTVKEGESQSATVSWSVVAISGEDVLLAGVSHDLIIDGTSRMSSEESIFLGCEGEENGRKFLYVTEDYYNLSTGMLGNSLVSAGEGYYDYYEIYARLEAGKPYFFYTGTKDQKDKLINGAEFKVVDSEESAAATVESDGVYRIRINAADRKVGLALVSKVTLRRTWDNKETELIYTGNGTWSASGFHVSGRGDGFVDERYRFVMYISEIDGSNAQEQGWSQNTFSDGNPTKEFDKSYWWMMPSNLIQWRNVWKYPTWLYDKNDPERWFADVNLILNADVEHYTHEFVNEFVSEFVSGDDLFIGGEGAEAGKKFRYIIEGYYNIREHYSDMHKSVEEGDHGYYEIFTSLKAGKPYFFYTGTKDQKEKLFNGAEFKVVDSEESAASTVESDGVYRIRINPVNGKVGIALVSKVIIRREWDSKETELVYTGNGIWSAAGYHVSGKGNDFVDDRYRFVMTISDIDGSNEHVQGWAQNTYSDDNPTKEFDKSYWWMMPSDLEQWQNVWKYPTWLYDRNDPERWSADVNLILNADVDHYTHEFINEAKRSDVDYDTSHESFDKDRIDFSDGWN